MSRNYLIVVCCFALLGLACTPRQQEKTPQTNDAETVIESKTAALTNVTSDEAAAASSDNPVAPSGSLQLVPGSGTVAPGQTICIPISVKSFTNIISMQYSIRWDANVLEYVSMQDSRLNGFGAESMGITNAKRGALAFVWLEPQLKPITLNDGQPIYTLCFKAIGKAGASTAVYVDGTPTAMEAVNVQEALVPFTVGRGKVTIQ